MKPSAENETQTRKSFTLKSEIQNVTILPESYTTGNHLDNQRLLPVHGQTNEPLAVRQSGIVQGIVAATIFIAFLLGLYTILWKFMGFQAKRHKGNGRSRQKIHHSVTVSC
ncbi:uncharacterized protein sb:cb288 [Heptranchias perlo]|uniref:uncharacterized protein sb:cb288 n=1 Tax=Heptranchias perlo TaxID=212740 RepID=UPI00355AC667